MQVVFRIGSTVFVCRLFSEAFTFWRMKWKLHETACRQNIDKLTSVIIVYKAHHWVLYHMLLQNKSELQVSHIIKKNHNYLIQYSTIAVANWATSQLG